MHKNLLTVILLLALVAAKAQNPERAISPDKMIHDILVLSSDSLQGRAPCTIGETRTVSYLSSRMREIGLTPAFGNSYTQSVPLVAIRTLMSDKVQVRTPKGDLLLKSSTDISLWSPSTQPDLTLNSSPIIFAGFGVDAPENGWNDFEGLDLRGKTIIVLVNDPGFYNNDTTLFKGKAMTFYGRWTYKFEEAERKGATACLIIHDDAGAGYPWSVVDRHTNNVEYYIDKPEMANPSCMVTGWITKNAARQLMENAGYKLNELMDAAAKRGFKPVDLNSTLSLNLKNDFRRCISSNVAGYIKGSKYPDEVVAYSGHWDHLGFGAPIKGDSICHGASDNASAIAWMFAIAEAFKHGTPPERTVLFLSPTCEESGLLGSTYYVHHPVFAMSKTIALFNTDAPLFLGRYKDITVTGLGHSSLDEMLEKEAAGQGRYVAADPTPENGMFYRSDQLPFLRAGVPALFAKGYLEAAELGKEKTAKANAEYWRSIYHKPTDVYIIGRDKVDGLYEDAVLFYRLGHKIANSRIIPKWKIGSEFYRVK